MGEWWEKWKNRLKHRWKIILSYIGWEDVLGFSIFILGVLGYVNGPIPRIPWLTEFYIDIRTELIGIGITVLIIDNANQLIRRREEKKRLILQMGSPDNGFALEAVRQLGVLGYLYDGSIRKANLFWANLKTARLIGADVQGTGLMHANLQEADLSGADLQGANLERADFTNAIMPDGTIYYDGWFDDNI